MQLYQIYYLIPFIVALLAQLIKLIIDYSYWNWQLHLNSFFVSWWMPSAHATLTSSLLTMVFLLEGGISELTMIVLVYALLVRYDAANVRYESWKHAQYINSLQKEMYNAMTRKEKKKKVNESFFSFDLLKERLWHTPTEIIVGILFGVGVTLGIVALFDTWIIQL